MFTGRVATMQDVTAVIMVAGYTRGSFDSDNGRKTRFVVAETINF